jgi:predicted nuclease of restriction endonuclease-like RecB superfamily
MLTGDLVRVRVVKNALVPSLIDAGSRRHLDRAASLIECMQHALEHQRTRGEIEATVRELTGMDVDHKITKGFAKLLMDKGDFETHAPIEPTALRWQVFCEAAQQAPLSIDGGDGDGTTAIDVLRRVAADLGSTPETIGRGLYADLKQEQILSAVPLPKPEALLHRYNTALVQALLIKASKLVVNLANPHPNYVRQLMRHLKFHQLMYRMMTTTEGVRVEVDGPQSLLKLSTRYGLQLANFFPAILLQPGDWTVKAEVLWGRKRKVRKQLLLDNTVGLVSHYRDTGTWTSRTETWFLERFETFDTPWTVGPGEPIDLGEQALLVPDLTFRKKGKVGHLEICGFWRTNHLKERLERLPDNVILAVSSKLRGEAGKLSPALEAKVIRFAEVIPPAKVVARLEQVAR